MIQDNINTSRFVGRVMVANEAGFFVPGLNLVTYSGADIIGQLLAGNNSYRIQTVAFEYENTAGTPTPSPAARADNNAYLQGLNGTKDYLRGALTATPSLSASSGSYVSNRVQFTALAAGPTGVHGVAFSAAANSKVYSVSLLASPTGAAAGDVMYARFILSTPVPAVGSGQVSCVWTTEAV